MLKYLAMLAMFVMLQVQPLLPQAPPQSSGHPDDTKAQQKSEPAPPIIAKADNHVSCDECSKKDPVAPQDPDKWVRRGFYLNAALTLITLMIAIATLLQASAAKAQAHTMANESEESRKSSTDTLAAIKEQNDGPVVSLSPEEENEIETGNQHVRFVGWVRYTDIFGDSHETPFNFLWEPAKSEYIGEDEGWYPIPPEWKNESEKAT